jgi:hypothetical protein
MKANTKPRRVNSASRWSAALSLVAMGGLYLALPESLTAGPGWLLLALVAVLLVPTLISFEMRFLRLNEVLGYVIGGLVTVELIWSLFLLVRSLPRHQLAPQALLGSAAALWVANIIVFASWYWRLDAGGPNARDEREVHTAGDFLFPQMTIDHEKCRVHVDGDWAPGYVDYLFLAFNTSTAFSPTDAPVLSRWAKVLMMVQSIISFTTVALLAARAVNIL